MKNTERPTSQKGWFFILPNSLIDDACDLSHLAFRVYAVLSRFTRGHTRTCWPGIDKIGHLCGVTRNRVRAAIRELVAAGLVDKKDRDGTTHLFTLSKLQGGEKFDRGGGEETHRGGGEETHRGG